MYSIYSTLIVGMYFLKFYTPTNSFPRCPWKFSKLYISKISSFSYSVYLNIDAYSRPAELCTKFLVEVVVISPILPVVTNLYKNAAWSTYYHTTYSQRYRCNSID